MGFQLLTGMLLALSVKGDSDPNGHPKGPAVGIGVGNLPPDQIDSVMRVAHAAGIRLVDTAAASNNEHLIAATNKELSPPMAVETKVRTLIIFDLASFLPCGGIRCGTPI